MLRRRSPPSARGISNVLATLIILAIVIGVSIGVSSFVMNRIGQYKLEPTKIQLSRITVERLSPNLYRVSAMFYNPTSASATISPLRVRVYQGTSVVETPSFVTTLPRLVLEPGESGELSVLVRTANTYSAAVFNLDVSVQISYGNYVDRFYAPYSS